MLWRELVFGMAFRQSLHHKLLGSHSVFAAYWQSYYSSKVDFKKLQPIILKRIENRAQDYPIRRMIPVANEVLASRELLIQGVSILVQSFPVLACKFCPEVYIGEKGHLIQTCWGYWRGKKNHVHEWIAGGLNDILVPVETFHLNSMFQKVIKHNRRFDFDRIPAVVELCLQAGAHPDDVTIHSDTRNLNGDAFSRGSPDDLRIVADQTLKAWETLRLGMQKLLMVYPSKVCKYCSEVHIGPSGHKARLCHETWRGTHFWQKAGVDELVPQKIVWRRRPQDPPVLLNEGRNYYGHAPAVVDLCTKAGSNIPPKYACMMKIQGLSAPILK